MDADDSGGLGGTSEDVFGELACVLVGFSRRQVDEFRAMMIAMEADMVKLVCCTNRMLEMSLQEAVESDATTHEVLPAGVRRAVLLSGMYSGEVMEVIAAYRDAGLPETLWGAAVPKNYSKVMRDLIGEMYGDYDYMVSKSTDGAESDE